MKNITFNISRELDLPAEIEMEVEATFTPGSRGYFNPANGDCDPPSNSEIEVQNRDILIAQIEQLFDHHKKEAISQLEKYLESSEFESAAEESAAQ